MENTRDVMNQPTNESSKKVLSEMSVVPEIMETDSDIIGIGFEMTIEMGPNLLKNLLPDIISVSLKNLFKYLLLFLPMKKPIRDEIRPEIVERIVPPIIPRTFPFNIISRLEGTGRMISEVRNRKLSREYMNNELSLPNVFSI